MCRRRPIGNRKHCPKCVRPVFWFKGENGATADVSFVKLGPAAGNLLDNVNRWLGQLGQPPVTPEKLTGMIQKPPTARGEVDVVDLNGKPEDGDASKDGHIIGAFASDEGTSFFKMRGNAELVGAEKVNFVNWTVAMRASGGSNAPTLAAPMSDKSQIKWDVPPDWSPAPASAMRYGSFAAPSDNGEKIDFSVVTFPGDGSDNLGNINRWRQQLGLPPAHASANKIVPLQTDQASFPLSISPAPTHARSLPGYEKTAVPGCFRMNWARRKAFPG